MSLFDFVQAHLGTEPKKIKVQLKEKSDVPTGFLIGSVNEMLKVFEDLKNDNILPGMFLEAELHTTFVEQIKLKDNGKFYLPKYFKIID